MTTDERPKASISDSELARWRRGLIAFCALGAIALLSIPGRTIVQHFRMRTWLQADAIEAFAVESWVTSSTPKGGPGKTRVWNCRYLYRVRDTQYSGDTRVDDERAARCHLPLVISFAPHDAGSSAPFTDLTSFDVHLVFGILLGFSLFVWIFASIRRDQKRIRATRVLGLSLAPGLVLVLYMRIFDGQPLDGLNIAFIMLTLVCLGREGLVAARRVT